MKVLILGGFGFIGFHLAKKLIELNYEVDVLDCKKPTEFSEQDQLFFSSHPKLRYLEMDLCVVSPKHFNDHYHFIFHFAALLGVLNVTKRPFDVLQKNAKLTMKALAIAKKQKQLKKFFYTSTSEVYAGTLHYHELTFPTPEETPLTISPFENNRTTYMLSKIYGEALCLHSKLPSIILRPHNIYGPRMGMRHVIPELLQKAFYLDRKAALQVYSPNHSRTFCYIDDAIHYILKLMSVTDEQLTVNLGVQHEEMTMQMLAQAIKKIVDKDFTIQLMSDTRGSPLRRVPQTETLIRLTHYLPQVSLQEGIERTFIWYKNNEFVKHLNG